MERPPFNLNWNQRTPAEMEAIANAPTTRRLPVRGAPGASFLQVGTLAGLTEEAREHGLSGRAPALANWITLFEAAAEYPGDAELTASATSTVGRIHVMMSRAFVEWCKAHSSAYRSAALSVLGAGQIKPEAWFIIRPNEEA